MQETRALQESDMPAFSALMKTGSTLLSFVEEDNHADLIRTLSEASNPNLLFWHTVRAFKAALKKKKRATIEQLITILPQRLEHEAIGKVVHFFIYQSREDVFAEPEQMEANCVILRLLLDTVGDPEVTDDVTAATPMHVAAMTANKPYVEVLLEKGADVNPVDSKDKLPLTLINEGINHAEFEGLEELEKKYKDLEDFLKEKGAVDNWRELTK